MFINSSIKKWHTKNIFKKTKSHVQDRIYKGIALQLCDPIGHQSLRMNLEMRRVQSHSHEQSGDETCTWQRDDPGGKDESNLLPVDGTNVKVTKRYTDRGSGQALRSGNRKTVCQVSVCSD